MMNFVAWLVAFVAFVERIASTAAAAPLAAVHPARPTSNMFY